MADAEALTIGWLERGHDYPRGESPPEFCERLQHLCRHAWQPARSPGCHQCDLCQHDGPTCNSELMVPYRDRIYAAPLIVDHYVAAHWYRPPDVFIEAVMACPPMRSVAYYRALRAAGAKQLISGWVTQLPGRSDPAAEPREPNA